LIGEGKQMEKLLPAQIVPQIREAFQQLKHPVQVLLFVAQENCDYCAETRQLLEEVVELSDQLALSVYDLSDEPELAKRYRVEGKAPAIVVAARAGDQITDYGIRYLGIPSGHEFTTLIQDLILVSGRDSGLSPQLRTYLQALTKPVHLEVFVTPT
jgi:alkyl hydroperoxide reductase subunit AhpF